MWVAAALLVLAGCSEDPEPIIEPPAETTPASDPSPTATPEAKEPWEKKTKAGAVAFAEHWFEVFSAAMDGGETADLQSLSDAACETCSNVVDRLRSIYGAGGFYKSDGWRVIQADAVVSKAKAVVALRVTRGAETVRESSDSPRVRNPESRASYSAELRWSDGRWLMTRLDLLA